MLESLESASYSFARYDSACRTKTYWLVNCESKKSPAKPDPILGRSSPFNQVRPWEASICSYAHCAMRVAQGRLQGMTFLRVVSMSFLCLLFRCVHLARWLTCAMRSFFLLLHRESARTKLCARSIGYFAQGMK